MDETFENIKVYIPVKDKLNLTIKEAASYSNIEKFIAKSIEL